MPAQTRPHPAMQQPSCTNGIDRDETRSSGNPAPGTKETGPLASRSLIETSGSAAKQGIARCNGLCDELFREEGREIRGVGRIKCRRLLEEVGDTN